MSDLKPFHLWYHAQGPNPSKVAIILEELGLPYETEAVQFDTIKQEPYISVNPNGRVPALRDPNNNDLTLWESGAIIDYLIDTYDKENKLHYTSFPQKHQQRMWEHFQMSGQGPYYGQLTWFKFFHPEKNLTSVITRYEDQTKRVLSVIELHLSKTGTEYLVGDKICYADLMFISWNMLPAMLLPDFNWETEYPKCFVWHQRLITRPAVKRVLEMNEKMKAAKEGH